MELRKRYIIHYNATKYVSRFLQLGHFQFSTRELLVSFIMESEEPCCVKKKTVNSFNVWPGLVPFRMFAPRSVAPLVNFGFFSLTAQQSVICGRKKHLRYFLVWLRSPKTFCSFYEEKMVPPGGNHRGNHAVARKTFDPSFGVVAHHINCIFIQNYFHQNRNIAMRDTGASSEFIW